MDSHLYEQRVLVWTLRNQDKSLLAQGWTCPFVPTWPIFCSTTASCPRTDTNQTAPQRAGTNSSGTGSLNPRVNSLSCKGDRPLKQTCEDNCAKLLRDGQRCVVPCTVSENPYAVFHKPRARWRSSSTSSSKCSSSTRSDLCDNNPYPQCSSFWVWRFRLESGDQACVQEYGSRVQAHSKSIFLDALASLRSVLVSEWLIKTQCKDEFRNLSGCVTEILTASRINIIFF